MGAASPGRCEMCVRRYVKPVRLTFAAGAVSARVLLPIATVLIGTLNAELLAVCAKSSAPTAGPQSYHSPV